MELLLVEDEISVGEYLSQTLTNEGYNVIWCKNISEVKACISIQDRKPEIVILDRMLQGEDGAQILPSIKIQWPQTKILVLSAIDLPQEKAKLIDLGADDYLAKPFSLIELTARLRLIARRHTSPQLESHLLVLGNLRADLSTQVGFVDKKRLDLTRKEFQILTLLMEKPGRVFNKYQILDRVWDIDRLIESNVVESTMKTLRKKMQDFNCTAQIQNKRNMGYWIEG